MKTRILLILLFISSMSFAQIPTDDTKRYLFVNGSLQNDANPGAYNLVRTGSVPTTINDHDGVANNALQMTSTAFSAGQATPTNYANTNQEVTISVWVKIQYSSSVQRGLFRQLHAFGSANYGYDFYYHGTTMRMYTQHGCYNGTCNSQNTLNGTIALNDNQWHHVVFSVYKENDGTQERYVQKLYIDGVLDVSYNFPWVYAPTGNNNGVRMWSQNSDLLIAQQPFSNYYQGGLDDIHFYERGLTDNEVTYLSGNTPAPVVTIPDANFKMWLVNNTSINTNGDAEIQVTEASAFNGLMQPIGLGITDWTGLEAFTSMTGMFADNNPATTIDLSQNVNLQTFLYEEAFQLTSVVLPNSNTLQIINITDSQLTSLDLSSYTNLTTVGVRRGSALSSLDLRNGNNTIITSFNSQFTANLSCILVDDKIYSQANWASVDAINNFVETQAECNSLSISEFELANKWSIYPNPTSNVLHINMDSAIGSVEIYNLQGQKFLETKNKNIVVSNLASGMYLLQIEDAYGKRYTKRFIKN